LREGIQRDLEDRGSDTMLSSAMANQRESEEKEKKEESKKKKKK